MPAAPFTRIPSIREQRGDPVLAAVMFVGAVLSAALSTVADMYGDTRAEPWTALVYAVAVTAPLAVRRWPEPHPHTVRTPETLHLDTGATPSSALYLSATLVSQST